MKDDSTINIKIMKMGGVRRPTHSTRSVRASVCCLQQKKPTELLGMRQIEADDESERRTMNRKNGDRKTDERFHAIFCPAFLLLLFDEIVYMLLVQSEVIMTMSTKVDDAGLTQSYYRTSPCIVQRTKLHVEHQYTFIRRRRE